MKSTSIAALVRMIADYCFRLTERGWLTVYEPKSQSYKVNYPMALTPKLKEIMIKDLKYFFHKWGYITDCDNTNDLHEEIVKYVQKKASRYKKKQ